MRFWLCLISICLASAAFAQGPSIPDDIRLNQASDYSQYESLVKKSLAWLLRTPLDEHVEKRIEVNAFVMLWLAGAPDVKLDIDSDAMPFLADDENLIFPFIHGMALYKMGHPHESDKVKLHAEGLRSTAQAIEQSSCVKKSKTIKALLKADRKGELEELVTEWLADS